MRIIGMCRVEDGLVVPTNIDNPATKPYFLVYVDDTLNIITDGDDYWHGVNYGWRTESDNKPIFRDAGPCLISPYHRSIIYQGIKDYLSKIGIK